MCSAAFGALEPPPPILPATVTRYRESSFHPLPFRRRQLPRVRPPKLLTFGPPSVSIVIVSVLIPALQILPSTRTGVLSLPPGRISEDISHFEACSHSLYLGNTARLEHYVRYPCAPPHTHCGVGSGEQDGGVIYWRLESHQKKTQIDSATCTATQHKSMELSNIHCRHRTTQTPPNPT